jgi:thioredoxin-like negative regulator of GroEL
MPGKPAPMPMPSQPSVIDTHLLHADHCIQSGQLAPALALYRTAAAIAEQQGDFPRALSIHARLSRLDPDPSVRLPIGDLLRRAGQVAQAADVFEGVMRDYLQAAARVGEGRTNRIGHALVAARAAYEVDPTPTRRWQLGELLAHQGYGKEAVEHLHACAAVELEAGRLRRFHTLARRIVGLAPGHVPTLRLMIDAFLRARDVHRAVAVIRSLRACAPDDRAVFEGTAEALMMLGKPDAAADVLRLLAARDGANAPAVATPIAATQPPRPPSTPAREVTRVIDIADLMDVAQEPRRAPPPMRTAPHPCPAV